MNRTTISPRSSASPAWALPNGATNSGKASAVAITLYVVRFLIYPSLCEEVNLHGYRGYGLVTVAETALPRGLLRSGVGSWAHWPRRSCGARLLQLTSVRPLLAWKLFSWTWCLGSAYPSMPRLPPWQNVSLERSTALP